MSYSMPPLNGLRAFEASARHLSFKNAANELCVTRGAVAKQVKKLEDVVGEKLFHRHHNRLALTAAGERYLPHVSAAFRAISDATEELAPALKGRVFRLGVAPQLMKMGSKLGLLLRTPPCQLKLRVLQTDELQSLHEGDLDAMLRIAEGPYPSYHTERILLSETGLAYPSAILVTLPGLAGCREHRAVIALLHGQLENGNVERANVNSA